MTPNWTPNSTPTNNINTSKIASMSSTDLPNCINAKLNRYFKQLDGEKASGVLKMIFIKTTNHYINRFLLV
jgi:DNA-binding protein Fis